MEFGKWVRLDSQMNYYGSIRSYGEMNMLNAKGNTSNVRRKEEGRKGRGGGEGSKSRRPLRR